MAAFAGTMGGADFYARKQAMVDGSLFRLGPFYVQPALTLNDMGYYSNIYYYDDEEVDDFVADLGLDLTLSSILGDRFIFVLQDNPFYSFYADNKQEEAWNNRFSATVLTHLGPFHLDYTFRWDHLRQRATSEFGRRTRYEVRSQALSLDFGRHDRFFATARAEWSIRSFDESAYLEDFDLQSLLDREEFTAGLRLTRRIFSRTRLFVDAGYFRHRFDRSGERNGEGEQVSAGLVFPQDSPLSGQFELGYRFTHPDNPDYDDYGAPFGRGEVSLRLARRLRFRLNYLWDNVFSFYQPDQYFDEQSLGGGVELYLTRGLKIGLRHQAGDLVYRSFTDGAETRRERVRQTAVGFTVRIFRKMGLGIEYVVYRADSDLAGRDRSYDFIGGNITYDF